MNATNLETPPTPAAETAGTDGGRNRTPARSPGVFTRAKAKFHDSPWAPVAAKATAILAGMLALAGIGAASVMSGHGVPVAAAAAAPSPSGEPAPVWTAPIHAAPHEPATASSVAAGTTPGAETAGAAQSAAASPGDAPAPAEPSGITADGKVVLNRANATELTRLPRVGAKRAQSIVELRTRLGHFRQPTDLLRVRGIGRATLKLMLPHLVVDVPAPPKEGGAHQ